MVGAIQCFWFNFLRSACVERRPRSIHAGRERPARFHDRIDRSSLRPDMRRHPAEAAAGSAGDSSWSHMAGSGKRRAVATYKSFSSVVFSAARHAFLARAFRSEPGLSGEISEQDAGRATIRSAREAGWGRMTFYLAVKSPGTRALCETLIVATQFGGRTSKKIRRRVERNPV
jgi:hypothetical protein